MKKNVAISVLSSVMAFVGIYLFMAVALCCVFTAPKERDNLGLGLIIVSAFLVVMVRMIGGRFFNTIKEKWVAGVGGLLLLFVLGISPIQYLIETFTIGRDVSGVSVSIILSVVVCAVCDVYLYKILFVKKMG